MEKIVVFGATGGTGMEVVTQALQKGNEVTVIVRDPAYFNITHQHLTVIKGDVMQISSFRGVLQGKTAVISCLGNGRNIKATTVYSQGMQNIMEAMKICNVSRIICISAGALDATKEMGVVIRMLVKWVLQPILKKPYDDMRLMEKNIKQSALLWTIVRPARLIDKKSQRQYRTAINVHLARPWKISRAAVAAFILGSITAGETFKTTVEIAY